MYSRKSIQLGLKKKKKKVIHSYAAFRLVIITLCPDFDKARPGGEKSIVRRHSISHVRYAHGIRYRRVYRYEAKRTTDPETKSYDKKKKNRVKNVVIGNTRLMYSPSVGRCSRRKDTREGYRVRARARCRTRGDGTRVVGWRRRLTSDRENVLFVDGRLKNHLSRGRT